MQRFVTTTGGDYFFQPSISALRQLGSPTKQLPPPLAPLHRDTDHRP
jgi:hypothetical protein